jgi:hypothetical protein
MSGAMIKGVIILLGILFAIVYPLLQYFTVRYDQNVQNRLKKFTWIMPLGWLLILIWFIDMIR